MSRDWGGREKAYCEAGIERVFEAGEVVVFDYWLG
jgi:hypothetical protein